MSYSVSARLRMWSQHVQVWPPLSCSPGTHLGACVALWTVNPRSNELHWHANHRLCINQDITFINYIFHFCHTPWMFIQWKSPTLLEATCTLLTEAHTQRFFLGEKSLYFCSLILLIYTATLKVLCQDCHILNTDYVARGTFFNIYIFIYTQKNTRLIVFPQYLIYTLLELYATFKDTLRGTKKLFTCSK